VERATCDVCPRACKLAEGAWGFCDVRASHNGSVQDMYRSAIAYPGIRLRWGSTDVPWSFSGMRKGKVAEVYLPGCNLKCEFCVAPYLINLGEVRGIRWIDAGDLVRSACRLVDVMGFSGGEPSVHVEYVTDVFSQCHDQGIRTVLETNGYMTKSTAEKIAKHTNYVGFGLKASLDPAFYKQELGIVDTQPIRDAVRVFVENGCEVMLTDLTDPNFWNDAEAFNDLTRWIVGDLGAEIRLVLAPLERVGIPPPWTDERIYTTSQQQREAYMQSYRRVAMDAGLQQVFVQVNVRKNAEERREELAKMGLYRTLEKLGISRSAQEWG
jgi:pyruvate formate lyase activating enzyme